MPECDLCGGDGRMELSREEADTPAGKDAPRRTWWVVPCTCSAGRQWDSKIAQHVPRLAARP